jgi:hypothetical protein
MRAQKRNKVTGRANAGLALEIYKQAANKSGERGRVEGIATANNRLPVM